MHACIEEHPELVAFDEAHRAEGDAVLIGVTFDNDADDARAFFAERGGDWPVIDDPDNSIGVAYGVAQVPETFVIAPDGIVVQRFAGGVTAGRARRGHRALRGRGADERLSALRSPRSGAGAGSSSSRSCSSSLVRNTVDDGPPRTDRGAGARRSPAR